MPIGQNRKDPMRCIKIGPDLSRATRAIHSILNISNKLQADPENFRWRQALGSVLTSRHNIVLDLINVLGSDAFGKL